MTRTLSFVSILVVTASLGAGPKPSPGGAKRELARRTAVVTDDTRDIEVHLAAGNPTTILFGVKVSKIGLLDTKNYFPDTNRQQGDRMILLWPVRDIAEGEALSMQVELADGTRLSFVLNSIPESSDLTVEVEVARKVKAAAESAPALKAQVVELQSRLDTCEQSAGEAGSKKVAEFILKQDPSKPAAFVVERHPARELDKQSRLLVETLHVYRLFDVSYLVLTIENRDPTKLWVLDRAEVSVVGGASTVEAQVISVAQELSQGIPPGEVSHLVVGFRTPEQGVEHRFTVKLLEKDGSRHVSMKDLRL